MTIERIEDAHEVANVNAKGAKFRNEILERAACGMAMDDAATELLCAAESLVKAGTAPTLAQPVATWRNAVREYRDAGGLRRDNGGLRQ